MSIQSDSPVEHEGEILFDLREPFTLEDAGLEEGQRMRQIHAEPGDAITVRVIFPDDFEITVDTATISITTEGRGSERTRPDVIFLRRTREPLPDAYEHLLEAADHLDLDPATIDQWRTGAEHIIANVEDGGMSTSTKVWYRDERFDNDTRIGIEARVLAESGEVSIIYIVELFDLLAEFN